METVKQPGAKIRHMTINYGRGRGVSWGMLATIVVSFLGGVVSALITTNATTGTAETFTTAGLIGFLFGIALSAASIVLAISAITLGKMSEKTMVERSDESIRLQNDVFLKTTDALQRIESSTGVTEKRIEDIISGRAGAISQSIADRLSSESGLTGLSRRHLESEIRESVLQELSEAKIKKHKKIEEHKKKLEEVKEAKERYSAFKDAVLLTIANDPNTTAKKIGEGHFEGKGHELVDGAYETASGEKLAVCTFSTDEVFENTFLEESFSEFLRTLSKEIIEGTFTRVFLVFDSDLPPDSAFNKAFDELKTLVKDNVIEKYEMFSGSRETVILELTERIQSSK